MRVIGTIFRDHCKPPRLEDAGDCFMDAKCWREAAEAYGKGFRVRQCLQACLKGKLLDLGVDLLDGWDQQRNNKTWDVEDDMATAPIVDGNELEQLKVDYLKKCALHYHKQRNVELMMKFVRRFPNVTSQKTFLTRRDYFDQLIEVEEGEGNFLRAAEMAEQKGDLKHAVMLLVRGGSHEQAVEKLLDRARFEMLWSDGKLGWPLIPTAESQDLLQRAFGIINSCPSAIRGDILQEFQLLLLSRSGMESWNDVKDSNNVSFQFIGGRRAIDDVLLQAKATDASLPNLVSDLLDIWELWSEKLILLIQAIDRAQRRRDTVEDEVFLRSSNTYLGVEKPAQQSQFFLVTDMAASWLKNSQLTHLPNRGQRGQVSSAQLCSLSETFWATQLWEVGLGIMSMMEVMLFSDGPNATNFASPRGEQLCKLYLITKSLFDIMSKTTSQNEITDLRYRLRRCGDVIYEASFPHEGNKDWWIHVLAFRQLVGPIYDDIATCLVEESLGYGSQPVFDRSTLATVGRIQVLLPLLSRQWIRKYGPEIQMRLPHLHWSNMWEKSHRMYRNPSEESWESPENNCESWVDTVEVFGGSLQSVYKELRDTIGPFVFMQLLERCIVVDLACHTNLHSLILPQSLVVNHMTGDMNTNLFSAILNVPCTCKGNCFRFSTIRFVSRLILDMLNSSNFQIENWFDKAGIDWRSSLPNLIFRMLVSVLTICINLRLTGRSEDRDISNRAITALKIVFKNQSPLLWGQPQPFSKELKKVLSGPNYPQDGQLAFTRAMAAVKDPLIVLRHGKRIADWAHKSRLQNVYVIHHSEMGRVFSVSFSSNTKLAGVARPNTELPKQDGGELTASVKTNDSFESESLESHILGPIQALLRTGPHAAIGDSNVDGQKDLAVDQDEDDQSEDVWGGDEAADNSRVIPLGRASVGDGQTVAVFIKARLLQLLADARGRLKEELSATEKNQRDARSTFWKLGIQRKDYVVIFLAEACPLKVPSFPALCSSLLRCVLRQFCLMKLIAPSLVDIENFLTAGRVFITGPNCVFCKVLCLSEEKSIMARGIWSRLQSCIW